MMVATTESDGCVNVDDETVNRPGEAAQVASSEGRAGEVAEPATGGRLAGHALPALRAPAARWRSSPSTDPRRRNSMTRPCTSGSATPSTWSTATATWPGCSHRRRATCSSPAATSAATTSTAGPTCRACWHGQHAVRGGASSRKPVVCAVNGLAQGGGLMIAMLADVTVASDRATFRAPELFRGIADTNYGQILPRQIGPARARDMLMTGRR